MTCKHLNGYTASDLLLIWDYSKWPTTVARNLKVPEFQLVDILNSYCYSKTMTGNFSCLKADLFFQRHFEYYLINVYVPSLLIVILSWLTFWIEIEAVAPRISLGLLTVLTVSTQNSNFAAQMPKLSYVKAIDIWMAVCLLMVVGAFLEYPLVNLLDRRQRNSNQFLKEMFSNAKVSQLLPSKDKRIRKRIVRVIPNDDDHQRSRHLAPSKNNKDKKSTAKIIDIFCRAFFPALFALFNIVYWTFYNKT
ncbi:DgyrCDS8689 [Dimorphilus gyrociliatus]|uniref:DgyrCDS8689 n=1 Tax=Dimorphilus gyrociliatus TaxID=2664684 RepID=A0A7I8VUU5_9ANNE|nr:DgyrCDS8689 [Dimorphilus gyrociliatus]